MMWINRDSRKKSYIYFYYMILLYTQGRIVIVICKQKKKKKLFNRSFLLSQILGLRFAVIYQDWTRCHLPIHSPSKCLAWVKRCHHVWLDQNFDPSLLTNKLWLVFMEMKQKKIFWKKNQNGRLFIDKCYRCFLFAWALQTRV